MARGERRPQRHILAATPAQPLVIASALAAAVGIALTRRYLNEAWIDDILGGRPYPQRRSEPATRTDHW